MMQMTCPCCSRQLTAYDPQTSLKNLTKERVNSMLEDKLDYHDAISDSDNPEEKIVEGLEWEEDFQPDTELDTHSFQAHCVCGASFKFSKSIHLAEVRIPTQANKHWLSRTVADCLGIRLYHPPAHSNLQWNQPARIQNQYYGASINACLHNYVFQRNISGGGVVVRCSKCGHEKTI